MTSSPSKPVSFTKLLRFACAALEILILIGLLITVSLVPFAESAVSNGSHIEISKLSKDFSYVLRVAKSGSVTVTNLESAPASAAKVAEGSVSIGPFVLRGGKEAQFLVGAASDKDVTVQKVEGMVTFKGPVKAPLALGVFKWPAVTGELCTMLLGLVFFEMLRRLLLSAEKGDLFTDANVRMLRLIGLLMIALGLARFACWEVIVSRMNTFVAPFFSDETWMLATAPSGKLTGVISGVMFLLLAEIFREGLKFRRDSDLTI